MCAAEGNPHPTRMSTARSAPCFSTTRNKLRTLRYLYPAARNVEAGSTVPYPAVAEAYPASVTESDTLGFTPSLSFEIPEHMVGLVEFITSGRLQGQSQVVLPTGDDPTEWLGAPLLLTVYKVFVAIAGPDAGLPTLAPGVVTLDASFSPVSQVIPRVWYQPGQNDAGVYLHQTVQANTIVEALNPGTYVATVSVQTNGVVVAPPYWVTASFGGTNAWSRLGSVAPFVTLSLAEDPPMFQMRATMRYTSSTRESTFPVVTTVTKQYQCAPSGGACMEVPSGVTLPECLATSCPS